MNLKHLAVAIFSLVIAFATPTVAQTCTMGNDIDTATRSSLENAAQQYFSMVQAGNTAGLQGAATPNFSGVANVASEAQKGVAGLRANPRWLYVLDNSTAKPGDLADFYCGIFNSPDRIAFSFGSNLEPGKYAVVVQDAKDTSGVNKYMITYVLMQNGPQWRIAGLIPKTAQVGGRDGVAYWRQAREYLAAGKKHNAYLYYYIADTLLRPFPLISTPNLDKLADEMQKAAPADFPGDAPINLNGSDGKPYKVTQIFPTVVGSDLHLVVKYSVADVNDTARAFQQNSAVIKGVVMRWPELRETFAGIVARATPPQGQDYGTLLAMKDIK